MTMTHDLYNVIIYITFLLLYLQFLGIWYAIQKTATASECIIYNISQVEPGQYLLQQLSQDYLLGLAPVSHRYSYTGELKVVDRDIPSKMSIDFPLNVLPGNVAFKVFMTDCKF
jgi:apolipoprotein D and lipocalin family protein